MGVTTETIRTKIPARMDRLPWTRWHWFIVFSLGIVWVLDGLEVTIKGAVGPSLRESLDFTTVGVAGAASIYLLGAVSGALFWGYLTDRFGRKKLFIITIAVYMLGVIGTSVTGLWIFGNGFEYVWFAIFRFITGFGIGGEYAAINSAIDELMPARVRGWVALSINGSYWLGTMIGAVAGAVYLQIFPPDVAFRVAFGMGVLLAIGILLLRLFVPESPRWLLTHGHEDQAEESLREIESNVAEHVGVDSLEEPDDDETMEMRERRSIGFIELGRTLFKLYPQRSVVGFTLLGTQAFLYNAIFFTFGLMLTTFFGVSNANVGWFLIPFAVGNFLGPLLLGRFFDTLGRRTMIPLTFLTAAGLTVASGLLFATGVFNSALIMTLAWVAIFFFASAGASSGYLTVSETFPLEVRAMAIAFFYAIATAIGGVLGPILYGALITGGRWSVFVGYMVAAALMAIGGLVHRRWGIEAAQEGLESVAMPLSVEEAEGGDEGRASLEGPAGVDVADPQTIERFQREHDLEPDGLIGKATAAALGAELSGDGDAGRGRVSVVDLADPESILRFQREYGLEADGLVGPETRGAILAAERRGIIDPSDEESIMRFQRTHLLSDDGEIGPETQAALRAVRAEQTGEADTFMDLTPLDPASIERFQRSCGLGVDGVIGPETRGAMRAERARRLRSGRMDATAADSVKRFQGAAGIAEDGVVGRETREALARLREGSEQTDSELASALVQRTRFGVDPVDSESVERFQQAVGIEVDGCIGAETRRALRRAPHLLLGIDPTDNESIERFQREHELRADGVIGQETQAVLLKLESDLAAAGRDEEPEEDDDEEATEPDLSGLLAFDPADRPAVEHFQSEHGLQVDGVIGRETQAALRAAMADQEQELLRRPARRPERRPGTPRTQRRPGAPRPRTRSHLSALPMGVEIPTEDREYERNAEDVVHALRRRGPLSRREIRDEVNARLWGPGRLRDVLRTAEEQGIVRRVGRNRYTAS